MGGNSISLFLTDEWLDQIKTTAPFLTSRAIFEIVS